MFSALVVLALLGGNTIYFFSLARDMNERGENRLRWFFIFLIAGPVAAICYKSFRKLKDSEIRDGGTLYNLAKNFVIPWSIYALGFPAIVMGLAIVDDLFISGVSTDYGAFIAESVLWLGVLYLIIVIPIWFVPLIVSLILTSVTKPKGDVTTPKTTGDEPPAVKS